MNPEVLRSGPGGAYPRRTWPRAWASNSTGGLTRAEAARRLEEYGPNRLDEPDPPSAWRRFVDQFRNVLVYVLLGAAVIVGRGRAT